MSSGGGEAVLVTGGSGLIGRAVVSELRHRGHTAVVFDPVAPADAGAVHVEGDVRDLAAIRYAVASNRIRRVIHLAALIGVRTDADPHRAAAVNVMGTSNVLEACHVEDVARLVFASSITRQAGWGLPHTGGDHPAPRNLYGAHKLAAEFHIDLARRNRGLDATVVAIAGTLGVGRRGLAPDAAPHLHLLTCVARGEPAIVPAEPRWSLPLRHVREVAAMLVGAVLRPTGRPFYHAGGRYTSLADLADAARAVVPDADIRFTGGTRPSLPEVDATAADSDFDLTPRTLEQMVAVVIEELRTHGPDDEEEP
ncbi:MAG: NAD(P)-dependent oxidoreductase [Actinobacteria bacterium]|nr:NAD(P)-dependent oxidoreductase [Actinomycetota bacterium]